MNFRLQYVRYRLAFRVPVRTAHGWWSEREGVIIRVEDEAGRCGYGEVAPIPVFGSETVDEAETGCRVLGETVDDAAIAAVPPRLSCLRNALAAAQGELALAAGAASGEPVVADPAEYLAVAALLPAGKPALAQIAAKAEAGFRVFKWKVGLADVADELALFDDVCAALPSGATLRLDANGAWDRRRAERWLEVCADRAVEFVEQPIAPGARGADDVLLGLAADYPTPLALDESLGGDRDITRWLGAGWSGIWVVKPSLLGEPASALAQLAAAGARVVFSSALETCVGARVALRAAFAWPGGKRALGFGVWPLFQDPRFDGPASAPFVRREDVERLDAAAAWNALRRSDRPAAPWS